MMAYRLQIKILSWSKLLVSKIKVNDWQSADKNVKVVKSEPLIIITTQVAQDL